MKLYAIIGGLVVLLGAFGATGYFAYSAGQDAQKAEEAVLRAEKAVIEADVVEKIAKIEIKERIIYRDKVKIIRQESDECSNTRAPESILTRLP